MPVFELEGLADRLAFPPLPLLWEKRLGEKRVSTESAFSGWSDHKSPAGQVAVGSHTPGI